MAKSLESLLGYVPLTGVIKKTMTGIPDLLPPGFASIVKPTLGDIGRYATVTGTRTTARRVERGSPALRQQQKSLGEKDVKLVQALEEIQIDEYRMQLLRSFNSYEQDMGQQLIDYQIGSFRQRFDNLRIAMRLMALTLGKIHFDVNGNLLPSSSSATLSIDYGMNATTNQGSGQASDGSTALISASWATASTDIAGDLRRIKQTARIRTGYPLRYAFYGSKVPGYLVNNTSIQAYFARNPAKNESFLNSNELPEILDLKWIPAYEHFYEDSGGTNRIIWGDDIVVFTPEPNQDWWENMEGTTPVPRSFNYMGAAGARDAFEQVRGMYAYSIPDLNMPGFWKLVCGDLALPVIKVPDALLQLDTTP